MQAWVLLVFHPGSSFWGSGQWEPVFVGPTVPEPGRLTSSGRMNLRRTEITGTAGSFWEASDSRGSFGLCLLCSRMCTMKPWLVHFLIWRVFFRSSTVFVVFLPPNHNNPLQIQIKFVTCCLPVWAELEKGGCTSGGGLVAVFCFPSEEFVYL